MQRILLIILSLVIASGANTCRLGPIFDDGRPDPVKEHRHPASENTAAENLAADAVKMAGAGDVDAIMAQARDAEPDKREWAIYALGLLQEKPPGTIQFLMDTLKDESPAVRFEAVRALGTMRASPGEVVPPIVTAVDDTDWRVQYIALRTLYEICRNDQSKLDVYMKGLDSDHYQVVDISLKALGSLGKGASPAIPKVKSLLDDENASPIKSQIEYAISSINETPVGDAS